MITIHTMCDACWNDRYSRDPVRLPPGPDEERCCFCGKMTWSGVFVRHDPTQLPCREWHLDGL